MASNPLTVLRTYARQADLSILPPTILFDHSEKTLTMFDAYPKSIFHFLILPRLNGTYAPLTTSNLTNLRSLLRCVASNREKVKELLEDLKEESAKVKKMIEEEMVKRYGFKWGVWVGFHPIPSMEHLHLHVMSADLCSPKMSKKRHYNSFHPKNGFFLNIDEAIDWLEAEPTWFKRVSQLKVSQYEPLLKEDLSCFYCREEFKVMPRLKEHLQQEWDKIAKVERAKAERKRKREEASQSQKSKSGTPSEGSGESQPKKRAIDTATDTQDSLISVETAENESSGESQPKGAGIDTPTDTQDSVITVETTEN